VKLDDSDRIIYANTPDPTAEEIKRALSVIAKSKLVANKRKKKGGEL